MQLWEQPLDQRIASAQARILEKLSVWKAQDPRLAPVAAPLAA